MTVNLGLGHLQLRLADEYLGLGDLHLGTARVLFEEAAEDRLAGLAVQKTPPRDQS